MRPRDEQKKARLYDAAIQVINTEGFEGASVSRIAQLAQVSPATLYLFFANKKDMINKLYLALCEDIGERLSAALRRAPCPKDQLYLAWQDVFDYARDLPARFQFLEQYKNSPQIDSVSHAQGRQYFCPLKDLYTDLRQAQILKDVPDELIDAHLFFPLIHLIKLERIGEVRLTPELLNACFEASWDAIRHPMSPDRCPAHSPPS
ncbi:MAG: TetR/AcrR family transcriptional regulator [Gammaproteobacteria bacterium]|nr:TetR/AcrR family transcriptional regulator [Gammaproteobacteria bacterium]